VVEDQAVLTRALAESEECRRVMGKAEHVGALKTISGKEVEVRRVSWQNTNLLLAHEGFVGGKTGQTQFAGNCLSSVYEGRDRQRFIIVLLGCLTKEARFTETKNLVEKYLSSKQ
jgi:D-alanyl-D-alanine carboxypeptidase